MRALTVLSRLVLIGALSFATGVAQGQTLEDHLKCYKVKDQLILKPPLPTAEWLELDGAQFGKETCKVVGGFRLFCVPVTKNVILNPRKKLKGALGPPASFTPTPFPGLQEQDRICYKIRCLEPAPPSVDVTDQFATRTMSSLKPFLVCGPAVKNLDCGDTFPQCNGTCPTPGDVCTDTGTTCVCQTPPPPDCGQTFPACDGTCPIAGDLCVDTGTTCECQPPPPPACDQTHPSCNGTCPIATDICVDTGTTCVCQTPSRECGFSAPECDGACPNPLDVCRADGLDGCACVPESCRDTAPACDGACPNPLDVCGDDGLGGCVCLAPPPCGCGESCVVTCPDGTDVVGLCLISSASLPATACYCTAACPGVGTGCPSECDGSACLVECPGQDPSVQRAGRCDAIPQSGGCLCTNRVTDDPCP